MDEGSPPADAAAVADFRRDLTTSLTPRLRHRFLAAVGREERVEWKR